jgi:hypothetical protein
MTVLFDVSFAAPGSTVLAHVCVEAFYYFTAATS